VGGLMLANSTAVRHIFDRTLGLYDRLMERKVGRADFADITSLQHAPVTQAADWLLRY
jgi:hypothetical protein